MVNEAGVVVQVDNDRRFTLEETLSDARRIARVPMFTLDVAGEELATCAPEYYTYEMNGLQQPWIRNSAEAVWCNPPFSHIEAWVRCAWVNLDRGIDAGYRDFTICMLLPSGKQEQPWWQNYVEPFRDIKSALPLVEFYTSYLPGRRRFGSPEDPLGVNAGSPFFGLVLLVWKYPGAARSSDRVHMAEDEYFASAASQ